MEGQLTKAELVEIAARAYRDPLFFCKFFLEPWFPGRVPWFHAGILAVLDRRCEFLEDHPQLDKIKRHFVYRLDPLDLRSPERPVFYSDENGRLCMDIKPFSLLIIPRGFSKTTLSNAMNLKAAVYKDLDFGVYVSETATHAQMQMDNIRRELESNTRLIAVFGSLRPDQRSGRHWNSEQIETESGTAFVARGRGGQIRGLNHRGHRPKRIIVDDVEDNESVSTEEQRKKTLIWAYGDLIPALPRLDPGATITALGTLRHAESLLIRWKNDPQFTTVELDAIDKDGEPLWAENMDHEKLETTKASYARAGRLSTFYLEYRNKIHNEEDAKFKGPFVVIPKPLAQVPFRAIALDPAISQERRADFRAIAVVGLSPGGKITVLDFWASRSAEAREIIDVYFDMHKLWSADAAAMVAGIEAAAFQAVLIHTMREEMFRKKHYFEIEPIRHSNLKAKIPRVEGVLHPRFVNGYIEFQRSFPLLENQLLDWPNGKLDGPDALAMAITLLDRFAAQAGSAESIAEDSMEELEEWRRY